MYNIGVQVGFFLFALFGLLLIIRRSYVRTDDRGKKNMRANRYLFSNNSDWYFLIPRD